MLGLRPTCDQGTTVLPPGFNSVTPYFFVADADSFVRFLMQGLGGTDMCRTMRPNRLIQNVQVRLGTSTVMVSEATECYTPMTAAYYRDVEDSDASMQRVLKQWQQAIQQEPERRFLEKWLAELGRATVSP